LRKGFRSSRNICKRMEWGLWSNRWNS